jgi:hypothetical protein
MPHNAWLHPVCFVVFGDLDAAPVTVEAEVSAPLLRALGLSPDGFGSIEPTELAARCRRRLWPEFADRVEHNAVRSLLALALLSAAEIHYC